MAMPSGFLIIDKPRGATSFSMVSLVRRLTGIRRVGHAGTLDPMATGVLPLAIGSATRLIEYTDDAQKRYVATLRLGVSTNTYDADGSVTREVPLDGVTRERLAQVLAGFVGEVQQRPPPYSAVKVAGRPLYRYAREGAPREASPRTVRIDAIEITSFNPPYATIEVACGKGTYIRSIAHDAGQLLGCGAHLNALRRTASSGFTLADAHSPEAVQQAAQKGELALLILAPDRALEGRPAAILGPSTVSMLRGGRDLEIPASEGRVCRAYSTEGEFLGVLEFAGGGRWHPQKVLPAG